MLVQNGSRTKRWQFPPRIYRKNTRFPSKNISRQISSIFISDVATFRKTFLKFHEISFN